VRLSQLLSPQLKLAPGQRIGFVAYGDLDVFSDILFSAEPGPSGVRPSKIILASLTGEVRIRPGVKIGYGEAQTPGVSNSPKTGDRGGSVLISGRRVVVAGDVVGQRGGEGSKVDAIAPPPRGEGGQGGDGGGVTICYQDLMQILPLGAVKGGMGGDGGLGLAQGTAAIQATASGGDAGLGADVYIVGKSESAFFANAGEIAGGDGGEGGSAEATGAPGDPATGRGRGGGYGGWVRGFGLSIVLAGDVRGGDGGEGGIGGAEGGRGPSATVAGNGRPGGDAFAYGGDGGEPGQVEGFGFASPGQPGPGGGFYSNSGQGGDGFDPNGNGGAASGKAVGRVGRNGDGSAVSPEQNKPANPPSGAWGGKSVSLAG
jgi:hypothetical protein